MAREDLPMDWASQLAPDISEFERIADTAWRRLPDRFRELCTSVALRVEDFATDDVLDALDIEDPFELMGLYQGTSLDQKSVMDVPQAPDMVVLYRRPILDYWCEGEDSLGAIITHVLVHEIGHHFGLSDDDMEEIEEEAAA